MLSQPRHEANYPISENNDALEKGVFFYIHEIALKRGYLLGVNAEKHLHVVAILPFLRLLASFDYELHLTDVQKQPGLVTQATFTVYDRKEIKALRTTVTLVSTDFDDYEKLIQGEIMPLHQDSADRR